MLAQACVHVGFWVKAGFAFRPLPLTVCETEKAPRALAGALEWDPGDNRALLLSAGGGPSGAGEQRANGFGGARVRAGLVRKAPR